MINPWEKQTDRETDRKQGRGRQGKQTERKDVTKGKKDRRSWWLNPERNWGKERDTERGNHKHATRNDGRSWWFPYVFKEQFEQQLKKKMLAEITSSLLLPDSCSLPCSSGDCSYVRLCNTSLWLYHLGFVVFVSLTLPLALLPLLCFLLSLVFFCFPVLHSVCSQNMKVDGTGVTTVQVINLFFDLAFQWFSILIAAFACFTRGWWKWRMSSVHSREATKPSVELCPCMSGLSVPGKPATQMSFPLPLDFPLCLSVCVHGLCSNLDMWAIVILIGHNHQMTITQGPNFRINCGKWKRTTTRTTTRKRKRKKE